MMPRPTHRPPRLAIIAALVLWGALASAEEAAGARREGTDETETSVPAPDTQALPLTPETLTLRTADGASSIRPVGLFQVQLSHTWSDGAPDEGRLFVDRARIWVSGSLLGPDLRYLLLADLGGKGPRLTFLTLDYDVVPGWLSVRAGQFKRPFSRSFLTPAGRLALIDRPPTVGPSAFGDDADVGLMVHTGGGGPFEIDAGVFSGAGPGVPTGRVHPLVALRVGAATEGLDPTVESDLRGGPPRIGATAATLLDLDADGDGESFVSAQLDVMLKAHGLTIASALTAGWRQRGPRWQDQGLWALGHSTQVGYVVTDWLEPVVRYSLLKPATGDARHDLAAGVGVHLLGRTLAWHNDVTLTLETRDGQEARDVRFQSQLGLSLP